MATRTRYLAYVLVAIGPLAGLSAQRPMTVDDVLAIENLSSMAVSPDGKWVAVTIQRGRSQPAFHGHTRLGGDDRSDIWLVSTTTGSRTRITNGSADGSGWWAPTWSPDGARLAMLSNQGNENVHLYLWTPSMKAPERVVDTPLHSSASVAVGDDEATGIVWVDNNSLLGVALPPDYRPFAYGSDHESQRLAMRGWKQMTDGKGPSVSVLVSGAGGPASPDAIGSAAIIDVVKRTTTPIADLRLVGVMAPRIRMAPAGGRVAVFEASRAVMTSVNVPLTIAPAGPTKVGIATMAAGNKVQWLDADDVSSLDAASWSPDGAALVVVVPRTKAAGGGPAALHLVDIATGRLRAISPAGWEVKRALWIDRGQLLVQARNGKRDDWYVLSTAGESRNLTASLPDAPASVVRDGATFLAVAGGDLWRIDPATGATNLTAAFTPAIRALALMEGRRGAAPLGEAVVTVRDGAADVPYRATLSSTVATLERLALPSAKASVISVWPREHVVLARATEANGIFAWAVNTATGKVTALAALNEQLATILSPKKMVISYRGTDGDTLKGVLVLPPNYESGKRYPLFAWVYAGSVYRDTTAQARLVDKYSDITLNLLPLISRGYVVLFPSMPLGPDGKAADPMIDLPKGVVAAVDRAIELGIADPERLAVGGQSYGGYSTYSIIAYTNRFKAAVAMAGPSDLVSLYGNFDGRFRYADGAGMDGTFLEHWAEGGQGRMEASPATNLWRYIRNSPLFFVDRVNTPVLIIQGDIDFVPMTQGEEFFSGLQRQGKTARFLRYWGEGHVLQSPENVRHMWKEIFSWLDSRIGDRR